MSYVASLNRNVIIEHCIFLKIILSVSLFEAKRQVLHEYKKA